MLVPLISYCRSKFTCPQVVRSIVGLISFPFLVISDWWIWSFKNADPATAQNQSRCQFGPSAARPHTHQQFYFSAVGQKIILAWVERGHQCVGTSPVDSAPVVAATGVSPVGIDQTAPDALLCAELRYQCKFERIPKKRSTQN